MSIAEQFDSNGSNFRKSQQENNEGHWRNKLSPMCEWFIVP